ncbi:hypothetical protein HPB48_012375 [Haemaphysalis longicornis]|uniref:Glutamate-gated chloride channel n=1 Tax=Haemaphysalis longicornis TaxID=44386 RepID=A0A9J6G2J9_HAELO|nr:hypothetical protein HPB48_012375 [Haemaphysalis longicornis]
MLRAAQDYGAQFTLRHQWRDERLAFDDSQGASRFVTLPDDSALWKPDTFLSNELSGHAHDIVQKNVMVRIFPDGTVQHSLRMAEFSTTQCTSKTRTGAYPCLKASFAYRRNSHDVVIGLFMPCLMMVLVSWMPLWMSPRSAVLLRHLFALLVLLAFAGALTALNPKFVPRSGVTTSADVWSGTCITFVFLVLVEVVLVDVLLRRQRDERKETKPSESQPDAVVDGVDSTDTKPVPPQEKSSYWLFFRKWLKTRRSPAEWIDFGSRLLFPLAFALFAIIYRCSYTSHQTRLPQSSLTYFGISTVTYL